MVIPDKKKERCVGLVLMIFSGMFFMLGNSLYQYIVMTSPANFKLSADQMLFIRCAVQLLFSTLYMVYGRIHFYGDDKQNLIPLLFMGATEVGVIIFMYEAIHLIPVGDATVLQFTAPVYTSILSFIVLKTRLKIFDVVFGVISFIGVICIAKPDLLFKAAASHHSNSVNATTLVSHLMLRGIKSSTPGTLKLNHAEGAVFALASAMSLSIFLVLNKLISSKIDIILTLFYPGLCGVFIGPILMLARGEKFLLSEVSVKNWSISMAIGILSFIGFFLLGKSITFQDPGPAILVRNCDIIFVFVLQYLLMDIVPSLAVVGGAVLIVLCSSLIISNHTFDLETKCFSKLCVCCCCCCCYDNGEEKELLTKTVDDEDAEATFP